MEKISQKDKELAFKALLSKAEEDNDWELVKEILKKNKNPTKEDEAEVYRIVLPI